LRAPPPGRTVVPKPRHVNACPFRRMLSPGVVALGHAASADHTPKPRRIPLAKWQDRRDRSTKARAGHGGSIHRTPNRQARKFSDTARAVPGSQSEVFVCQRSGGRRQNERLTSHAVPKPLRQTLCFVAVFVAHTQYTNLGSHRSKPVRMEQIRAPYSPPNGSDAHPAACPNKAAARRIASRGTRRFSAGPTYGTRSGAASS
jgi:hypothetical protein